MKASEITVGKKVYYHPNIGGKQKLEAVITSSVYNICGTACCKIDIIAGVVAIEALSERHE